MPPPILVNDLHESVQPTVDNSIYVSQDELIKSLKMAVLGASSALHTWDIVSERFVGHGGFILIDGKNEVVSERCVTSLLVCEVCCCLMSGQFYEDIFDYRHYSTKTRDAGGFTPYKVSLSFFAFATSLMPSRQTDPHAQDPQPTRLPTHFYQ